MRHRKTWIDPADAAAPTGTSVPRSRNSSTLLLLSRRLFGRPDEDAEEGRYGIGPARACRQSRTGHEHHGHRPAERSHERSLGARRRQFPHPANWPPGTANPGPRDPVRQANRQNRRHPSDKSSQPTGPVTQNSSTCFCTAWTRSRLSVHALVLQTTAS